jgi:hypothetical protein
LTKYLFKYDRPSIPVTYKGNQLDSLAELKYIISVEESHIWLRTDLTLYYKAQECEEDIPWSQYTPDFLVRNIKTNRAKLVEIKPRDYNDVWRLNHCKKVCSDHIGYFGYDWQFEVIYESDVHLTMRQEQRFLEAVRENAPGQWNTHLLQNNRCHSDDDYRAWVLNGIKPAFLH